MSYVDSLLWVLESEKNMIGRVVVGATALHDFLVLSLSSSQNEYNGVFYFYDEGLNCKL